MAEVLRALMCFYLCLNVVLCQFGFFPQREDRFQRPQFGHLRNQKRIRDRLTGVLHFLPENQNSNPAYIYPFNERPIFRPNYEQNGRPVFSHQNNVNPYEVFNGGNSGNTVVFPSSADQENRNPTSNQPNQTPQPTSDQFNSNNQDSNVIFQPNPNQGSHIFIYPNQNKPSDFESDQQNGYQPTYGSETTQNPVQTNSETTEATQITTSATSESYQPTNQETITVKPTEMPFSESPKSNTGSVGFGDEIIGPSSTLPPLTPVPPSQVGANFNFGARGIFSETCETIDNEIGSCISIFECPRYLKVIQDDRANPESVQLLRRVHCGFEGNNPKVCCPRDGFPTAPPTEPTTTTSTSTTTSPPPPEPEPEPEGKNVDAEDYVNLMPEPPICGLSNASFSRVVGGVDAKIGDFPWMALLGYKARRSAGARWRCGGSLVSSRHVLTAAHCIHGHEDDLFLVRLGELDLAREDEGATPVDILIKKKIKHEEYDANSFSNDIGILVLEKDVEFTNLIKPICIPKDSELRARSFENYNPIIAGWGDTEFRGPSATLLQALQLPVVSNDFCAEAYSKYKAQQIDSRVLCAGYKRGGRDACQGDSGGPLMQPIWNSEEFTTYFYQIGVVSYGKKCAEAGFPGVYSRVTHFVPWIESKVIGA